ncbi:MAG: pyruvate formate lyase family protein [Firmicutes bacterium]|nr:pyruvate formate lyase family protein [Bacillota bacterium]
MLSELKKELTVHPQGTLIRNVLLAKGYTQPLEDNSCPVATPMRRANAFASLMTAEPHVYKNDLIAGSIYGLVQPSSADEQEWANRVCALYGSRSWPTNFDHYAPDYRRLVTDGIAGTIARIDASAQKHQGREAEFLAAMRKCMEAFSGYIAGYAEAAEKAGLSDVAQTCRAVVSAPPKTFRQALQLVWLTHNAFVIEGRFAMALGRLDQYLYPFYRDDIKSGALTREYALELVSHTLIKIGEFRFFGFDDTVNIAIGGVDREGNDAVNELSRVILEAVRLCNIPGPNLSARISSKTDKSFIRDCLRVIGTGIGYPALMNDEVNVASLVRRGVPLEEARDYSMVGCIENFVTGAQPPWCDGRFNTPKYLELALNEGTCMQTGRHMGINTVPVSQMKSMSDVLDAFRQQMEYGALDYVTWFNNENSRYNPWHYTQPFISCFCRDCIDRGLNINDGGALYPSVHGVGLMGIATVADSLYAIEYAVFEKKLCTLEQLVEALKADYVGFEPLRAELLSAPKYGNNIPQVDKYAQWFVTSQYDIFSKYHTPDGGWYSIGIASNVANIPAGTEVAATPDGRRNKEPLSDAASIMHGMDKNGPSAALLSLSKPDYTKSALGTVVNQKYSPNAFREDKLDKLASMVQVYFSKGGQELQINAVSREVLQDAMEHPENYSSLIVRVSGFSAYYTCLSRDVQKDILRRTEHEG